jgi:hypothetical protein
MPKEMTSFVLRFVREVSEEQDARWRGLIQHVQSGSERSFRSFADAVLFMQEYVMESTGHGQAPAEGSGSPHPFAGLLQEMTRLWDDWAPQVSRVWAQTLAQMAGQPDALRAWLEQYTAALSGTSRTQEELATRLVRLSDQIEALTARVEALESDGATRGE